MTRCGCNPVSEPFEFHILNDPRRHFNSEQIPTLFPIERKLSNLKEKIICEYMEIIDKLECGVKEDLELLLEEISLVDILENG